MTKEQKESESVILSIQLSIMTTATKLRDFTLTSGEFAIKTLDEKLYRGIYDSIPQKFWNDQDEELYKVYDQVIEKFNFPFQQSDIDGSLFTQIEIPQLRTEENIKEILKCGLEVRS
tara:strand:+ start:172 stop:522 length:351 start_codon:yes stop_codon:yes gene_type:complete